MRRSFVDGWMALYHYAVVLTGAYLVQLLEPEGEWTLLGLTFVLAMAWTGYFRFRIIPRLSAWAEEKEGNVQ